MDKSFVTVEQHQCPICLIISNTGALLLNTRLRNTFNSTTVTGHSTCKDCAQKLDDDYIGLIGAQDPGEKEITPSEVKRTGDLIWVKANYYKEIFTSDIPPKGICFVTPEVIEILKKNAKTES